MEALPSDRHRAFVRALYTVRPGHGAKVQAAKLAGFGTASSSPQSMATIASRLAHDERVLAAIREEGERYIHSSAPHAMHAMAKMIANPKHKDHARAVAMTLDRVHPVESVHHMKVEHSATPDFKATAEVMERIALLTAKFNLVLPAPVTVIEGAAMEVRRDD